LRRDRTGRLDLRPAPGNPVVLAAHRLRVRPPGRRPALDGPLDPPPHGAERPSGRARLSTRTPARAGSRGAMSRWSGVPGPLAALLTIAVACGRPPNRPLPTLERYTDGASLLVARVAAAVESGDRPAI